VRPFTRKGQFGASPVELGAPGNEFMDPVRPLFDEHARGPFVHQTITGNNGVVQMQADLVFVTEHDGNPALRILSGRFSEFLFGKHEHPASIGKRDRCTQAGDSGSDHNEISMTAGPHGADLMVAARTGLCFVLVYDESSVKTIRVRMKPPYPVVIGGDALARVPAIVDRLRPSKVFIVTSPRVRKLWGGAVQQKLHAKWIEVPDGEQSKSLSTVERIARAMIRNGADRKSVVVAFGGGVIGDMAGFAAATYMRGIPVVQVPTTLLAQVDAAIGGKTGVNLPEGKNLIGTFHQAAAVIADTRFLATLPARAFRSGLFEVIKCAVIADRQLFTTLEREREKILSHAARVLERVIADAVVVKANVVAADEREGDLRRILNFGHTIGHALEAASSYKEFLHGEAIAWGMIAAAEIGVNSGVMQADEAERLINLIMAYGPLPAVKVDPRRVMRLIRSDKKTVLGVPHFVLTPKIGMATVVRGVDSQIVRAAVEGICQ
jgi:3-dehydroquinate synthase